MASQRDARALLAQRAQVHPLGQLRDKVVEHVHRLRPVALQRLDDLLACNQRVDLCAQIVDLGDLLVERLDFGLQQLVARFLMVDSTLHDKMARQTDRRAKRDHQPRRDVELLAPLPTLELPVRKQIDANHASNLLIARPHAAISAGASIARAGLRTREDSDIPANGLATLTEVWARPATTSARLGITAHPPVS